MQKITDIKINKNNIKRSSVFIDNSFSFIVSKYVLNKNRIKIGLNINDLDIKNLIFEDNFFNAKKIALNLLAFKGRSSKEIIDRLVKKEFSNEIISNIIDDLIKNKFLNDYEFARVYALDKIRNKKLGPLLLKNELFKKGISKSIIDSIIKEFYDNETKKKLITDIFNKKTNYQIKLDKKELNKIINYVRRRGYNWEDIQPVIVDFYES